MNKNKFHAIIPARKGSKGIKNKNMHDFLGKPLIQHTISAAKESKLLDTITVSTNDQNILDYASKFSIELLKRPDHICQDDSKSDLIIKHFLEFSAINNISKDDYIVFLQPTSPLRSSDSIDQAIRLTNKKKCSSLIGVVESSKTPFKSFLIKNGRLKSLFDESLLNSPRQDMPKTYHPNGAIYIFQIQIFDDLKTFPNNGSFPFIMSEYESVDIDRMEDLSFATWLKNK